MVKDKVVRFLYYRDKELWYETEDGFQFPVPINDTGTGTFKAEDKAILFMRWIRKRMEEVEAWDKLRSGGGPGTTCSKEQWEESFSQPEVLSGAGSEVETLPDGEDYEYPSEPMSAASVRVLNSILRAKISEDSILRFSEEDLENQP